MRTSVAPTFDRRLRQRVRGHCDAYTRGLKALHLATSSPSGNPSASLPCCAPIVHEHQRGYRNSMQDVTNHRVSYANGSVSAKASHICGVARDSHRPTRDTHAPAPPLPCTYSARVWALGTSHSCTRSKCVHQPLLPHVFGPSTGTKPAHSARAWGSQAPRTRAHARDTSTRTPGCAHAADPSAPAASQPRPLHRESTPPLSRASRPTGIIEALEGGCTWKTCTSSGNITAHPSTSAR